MVTQRLTIDIGGRKALPVRAIPYIAGWQRYPPYIVAANFALADPLERNWILTPYYLSNTGPLEVKSREWDVIMIRLKALEVELNQQLPNHAIRYAAWFSRAVALLPAGRFVWWDEFEMAIRANREDVMFLHERPGDADLILEPMLDADTTAIVMEGFEEYCPNEIGSIAPVVKHASTCAQVQIKGSAPIKNRRIRRVSETEAFLFECERNGIPLNIESIWLYIKNNAEKKGFLFHSVSLTSATTVEGKTVEKRNLKRKLHKILKEAKTVK